MKLKHTWDTALTFAVVAGLAIALCAPGAKTAASEPTAEDISAVGPVLDSLAAACGEAFDVKRHKLSFDTKGIVNGCEVKP